MSWISYEKDSHFPIQNIPFGVFQGPDGKGRCATRIGDKVIDLKALADMGKFEGEWSQALKEEKLNTFMSLGSGPRKAARAAIQALFAEGGDKSLVSVLSDVSTVKMLLPADVGDYTDFYSSREHATNIGKLFRPTMAPLLPNWLHLPVGYHGRASSIVVSGTDIKRPLGQTKPDDEKPPVFGPCRLLDMEVEVAAWVGKPNTMGEPITMANAREHVFGLSLFNDWSARDIQKWEYVPLGPFLSKSFASTTSPWIITMDALEPFICEGPKQGVNGDPDVLPYLKQGFPGAVDLKLFASVKPKEEDTYHNICKTNFKYMYWSVFQQLVHHTVNGCPMNAGDVFASGTISGPTEDSFGSMLELSWRGSKPLKLASGAERKFFQDGDSVMMNGVCEGPGYNIGFGDCEGTILPANTF
eukprot:TRINITY_DN473_c0_g2_i1.p1 TRINITY_DN473_c0_g2~~TRINITY_DN473_c0_g2_i1.p1  ORF type:complete len:414 (+),score=108.67 TRINITY_DN473_c0_g2_i1:55-1296(+)